jgi:flagellar hook-length control protein FliK
MSLVEIAGTLTLSITAERPETAELMRRHMDILNQEFSRSGLDAPDVHVGTGGRKRTRPGSRRRVRGRAIQCHARGGAAG